MSEPPLVDHARKKGGCLSRCGCSGLMLLFILLLLAGVALGPIGPSMDPWANPAMQKCRTIEVSMFQYATDHDGHYPDGKSSTEIFQKLLDGKYVADATVFYLPLPGKVRPEMDQRLAPENVSFDATGGVDETCSDFLPVVFLTGYRITYAPGGLPTRLIQPPRTWSQWFHETHSSAHPHPGIAVAYKNGTASFVRPPGDWENFNAPIPDFISPQFDAKGRTFRQLTPEGILPP